MGYSLIVICRKKLYSISIGSLVIRNWGGRQ